MKKSNRDSQIKVYIYFDDDAGKWKRQKFPTFAVRKSPSENVLMKLERGEKFLVQTQTFYLVFLRNLCASHIIWQEYCVTQMGAAEICIFVQLLCGIIFRQTLQVVEKTLINTYDKTFIIVYEHRVREKLHSLGFHTHSKHFRIEWERKTPWKMYQHEKYICVMHCRV